MSDIPVGTILPWVPEAADKNPKDVFPKERADKLPDGWMHCDGSVIPEPSPWHGSTTPNLNEDECFLSPKELVSKLMQQGTMVAATTMTSNSEFNDDQDVSDGGVNIRSKLMRVFWIMRIW